MKINKIFLILILALILRSIFIANTPSLNPDEAALGYNAYSILKTGKDEHGESFPLHLKSFGDYKPALYTYLSIPFVATLGLNPLSVRLPNIILSVFAIYYTYLLIHLLTKNKKIALLTALILTISPWHIHFSRGAWESSAALSFIVIGTYYFFTTSVIAIRQPAEKQSRWNQAYFLFVFFYALSLYTYHSARLIAPLLALTLLVTNYHLLITNLKKWLFPFFFGILICIPVLFSFFNDGGTTRFSGVGITADKGPINRSEELLNHHHNVKLFNRIIHNKRVLYLLSWSEKYISHFNLNFLFTEGDAVPRSKIPNMGLLYLIELPLLIYGIYKSYKSLKFQRSNALFISWLLIAPLASSLTFQAPSALRALFMIIPLSYFIALGIYHLKTIYYYLLIPLYLICFSFYLNSYFNQYTKTYPFAWNYGFSRIIPFIEKNKNNYDYVYLTDKYDQPYILYLFFSKYNPSKIQNQIELTPPDQFGFQTVKKIDNIFFYVPNYENIYPNSLIIASEENISLSPEESIYFPNGSPGYNIYIK